MTHVGQKRRTPTWQRWFMVVALVGFVAVGVLCGRAVFDDGDAGAVHHLPAPDRSPLEKAIALATAATVKIQGSACGLATAGSGVVVGEGLVMTAAHVVAGATQTRVVDRRGQRPADVIVFDPLADLAVLFVADLADEPLNVKTKSSDRGTAAAVLGYPHAGDLSVQIGVVLGRSRAQQHDIYGREVIERQVLELQAAVEAGSSGGAVVDATGSLIGIVFGQSEDDPQLGYAVTAQTIAVALREGVRASQQGSIAVSTEDCLPATATS